MSNKIKMDEDGIKEIRNILQRLVDIVVGFDPEVSVHYILTPEHCYAVVIGDSHHETEIITPDDPSDVGPPFWESILPKP